MADETHSPNILTKRRRMFVALTSICFGVLIIAYLLYWIGWGRFSESTNDAYVSGNTIMLTPQVEGIVTTILSDNTQLVEQGQPIILIDKHDHEIRFEKAQADLAHAVRDVVQLFAKVTELKSALEARKADLAKAKLDYEHRRALCAAGGVSREEFEHSETSFYAAFAQMMQTQAALESAFAAVQGTTVTDHPKVIQAKSALKGAFLNLHRTTVLSPVRGIVTQRKIQVGQHVLPQDPLLAIVPLDQIWVDANFREVQLEKLRIGQPVLLRADMYGREMVFHGSVVGLNPGTGSVFSILPPQNATGNWIKIVQRVPVKISLLDDELKRAPLVLGLSLTVRVDTHDHGGKLLPDGAHAQSHYTTTVYEEELSGIDQVIEDIIAKNMSNDDVL